jgi:ATP-dependent RNA helicase DDX18/HAS1
MVATGGFRQKTQLESLEQELDVLIATPGRFLYLLQEGFVQLNNLRWYGFFSLILMLN